MRITRKSLSLKAAMWAAGLLLYMVAFGLSGAAPLSDNDRQSVEEEGEGLSLVAAEHLALSFDPLLARLESLQKGMEARSQAAETLPDPKLKLGMMNISADSFDFEQEPMTQAVLGVSQAFPPAGLRDAASNQFSSLAESQAAEAADRRRVVRREVRHAWLELFYQRQAKALVMESQDVFVQLAKITQHQYRAGRGTQQHVVRAQLEQSLLQDRETEFETRRAQARVSLEKWIGSVAGMPDMVFPNLPVVMLPRQADEAINQHPSLQALSLKARAAQHNLKMEKSRKNPAWMLDVSYGHRGADRDDLLTAVVKLDLPLFTGARQDQLIAAGHERLTATEQMIKEKRRALKEKLQRSLATYQHTAKRMEYFNTLLLPQAQQNTEAALNAYQSGVSDFGILVRARLTELNSRLKYLRLKVDRAKANADLAYLIGHPAS